MVVVELDLTQEVKPQTQLRVSPRLVAANYILELSSLELQQAIAEELSENPALELVDVPVCQVCGTELHGSICPRCLQRQKVDPPSPLDEMLPDSPTHPAASTPDDEFDPMTQVAAEETLGERLLRDIRVVISEADLPIAEYLIGSLDERGYLACSLDDAAEELGVEVERVRRVLRALQALEPVGIGARNLRECLLIQLDHLERAGDTHPHAREIIAHYLTELGEHRFAKIAHELRISTEEVASVWEFVKSKLNPHPAQGFSGTNERERDTRAMYVLPDVIITRSERGYDVEVVESKRFFLRVNPIYRRLSNELHQAGASFSADDRRHIQQYVSRAKLFISNINQRRQTILNITRCLVEKQKDFLDKGVRHLVPLSRAAVAAELGIHESTVSRATASKYVMLPNGEVIPYKDFFTPSLSVKDVIKELIETEQRPLTDAEIAERLRARDIVIARRTVAKYRMQLGILPSSLR